MQKSLPAFLLLLFFLTLPRPVAAQEASPTPETPTPTPGGQEIPSSPAPVPNGISNPQEGAVLSGQVTISGAAAGAWNLAFGYQDDPAGTYFPLADSYQPVTGDLLPAWDTTLLTDGAYRLRLRVLTQEGQQDFTENITIYNPKVQASPSPAIPPSETPVLSAPSATATPVPSPIPTGTATEPPTPLPPNPVILKPQEIAIQLGKGAASVAALFVIFGLFLAVSKKLRS